MQTALYTQHITTPPQEYNGRETMRRSVDAVCTMLSLGQRRGVAGASVGGAGGIGKFGRESGRGAKTTAELKFHDAKGYHLKRHASSQGSGHLDRDQIERQGNLPMKVRLKTTFFTPEEEYRMDTLDESKGEHKIRVRMEMLERSAPQTALRDARKLVAAQNRLRHLLVTRPRNSAGELRPWRAGIEAYKPSPYEHNDPGKGSHGGGHEEMLKTVHPEFFKPVTPTSDARELEARLANRASRVMRQTGGLGKEVARMQRRLDFRLSQVEYGRSYAGRFSRTNANISRAGNKRS